MLYSLYQYFSLVYPRQNTYLNLFINPITLYLSEYRIYYEDFYYYLDQFYQGADGKWLTENNFTSENLQPTPIYISHIILGKIGGIFGLESFQSYNLSLLIMKLLYLILVYIFIKKIFKDNIIISFICFLIFILSTSFPVVDLSDGSLVFEGSSIIFRAKNTFFSRFGNIRIRDGPLIDCPDGPEMKKFIR